MDKSTLSSYGWIIIVTLILAVMLALATPFGTYVGDGVVAVANSFVKSADNAMDEDNIDKMAQEWEGKLDQSVFEDKGNSLNHKGIIPEGGVYVTGIEFDDTGNSYCCSMYGMWCWCDATILTAGDNFPSTVQQYDIYVYGDYVYMYNTQNSKSSGCPYTININGVCITTGFHGTANVGGGWSVMLNENILNISTKSSYSAIIETINNEPTTSLDGTFYGCANLTIAPTIPNTVQSMSATFAHCTSLTTAPVIPSSVMYMNAAFTYCPNLTGTITINANPFGFNNCFNIDSIGKPITLTGSSTILQELADTSNSSYRTITIQ